MKKITITNYELYEMDHLKYEDDYPEGGTKGVFQGHNIEVRDEYHSMHELYEHRMALTAALAHFMHIVHVSTLGELVATAVPLAMKSKMHYDGTMFDGYFIVMILTPDGQVSYHYKLEHWDKFKIPEVKKTPPWDGHNSSQVIERLLKI